MAKNQIELQLAETLIKKMQDLERELNNIKTNQLKVIVIPKLTADPSSPIDGQIWLNTTSHVYKIRINGVTKSVTVT